MEIERGRWWSSSAGRRCDDSAPGGEPGVVAETELEAPLGAGQACEGGGGDSGLSRRDRPGRLVRAPSEFRCPIRRTGLVELRRELPGCRVTGLERDHTRCDSFRGRTRKIAAGSASNFVPGTCPHLGGGWREEESGDPFRPGGA